MLNKLQEKIKKNTAVMLKSPANRKYITGMNCSNAILIITNKKAWFITDFRYAEGAKLNCPDFCVVKTTKPIEYINKIIKAEHVKCLLFEEDHISYLAYNFYVKKIITKFEPLKTLLTDLRIQKTAEEINNIKTAQQKAETALKSILPEIRVGITEKDLETKLICALFEQNIDELSFDPIVVSGKNTSVPHNTASDKKLASGDFVMLDFGVKFNGYCSDITRTFALEKISDEQRNIYDIVLKAQLAALEKARAGIAFSVLDNAARNIIEKAGYAKNFGHSLSHGIGIEIHESLGLKDKNNITLLENSIISVEPGIYLEGKFGVRIEDIISLNNNDNLNLTSFDKSLLII